MTEPTRDLDSGIRWGVVLRGALVGLAVIAPVSVLNAVLDHEIVDYDHSGWRYVLFVAVLVGYGAAGWVASRAAPEAPITHAALAGMGALVLWIPVRVVIWAVRETGRGLVSGSRAALPPGQVFTQVVISAGIAMLGALVAARVARRRAQAA